MDLPAPRYGLTGLGFIDRGQVIALRNHIDRELAAEPDLTASSLAATVEAARATLAAYPELSLIEQCFLSGPDDVCPFCAQADHLAPEHQVQEVPEWVLQAKAERQAAVLTLSAIAEAGTVQLSDGQQQSLGAWLAGLWHSDRDSFYQNFQLLARDSSPQSAAAISEARQLVFGNQPPAPAPGGAMSHTLAAGPSQRQHTLGHQRQHLDLARHHRQPHAGDTISTDRHRQPALPPPAPEQPAPEQEARPRRKRGRRLR